MSWNSTIDAAVGTRRRRIVLHLDGMETPATIDELVDALDEDPRVEFGTPGASGSWEDLHRELYEFDLPALQDAGVITFDADRGLVAQPDESLVDDVLSTGRDPDTDGTDPATGTEAGTSRSWAVFYLGLSALSLLVLGLIEATVIPLPAESAIGVTGFVLGLFCVLSVVHLTHDGADD